MFQSLLIRNYRLFAIGQLLKLHGVWMQFVAQDWLVLEKTNNSAYALGLVTAAQFAPVLLLTLYGGKLADRYDKRHLLIVANVAFSLVALVLGVLVATGVVTFPMILVLALLTGVANAVETPVRQAFVSELVPNELLPNALGLSAATFNASRIVGPALAGGAIWAFDLGPVFLINAALCLAPLYFLLRMDVSRLHILERADDDRSSVRDGLRYLWGREDLMLPVIMMCLIGTFGFNFQLTLSVLAKNVFAKGPEQFGLLTTALALGALVGALISGSRRTRPSSYVVLGSGIAFSALEIVVGVAPTFWTTAALLVPTGFFMILLAQAANQRIQLSVDPAYRGRVMAVYVLVFLGTTPIGGLVVGAISDHLGPRVGVWGGGTIALVSSLVCLAWELRRSGARLRLRLLPIPRVEIVPATPVAPVPART